MADPPPEYAMAAAKDVVLFLSRYTARFDETDISAEAWDSLAGFIAARTAAPAKALKCPECGTAVVRSDAAGLDALETLVSDRTDALKKQRDALLEACKEMLTEAACYRNQMCFDEASSFTMDKAQAAIAAAETEGYGQTSQQAGPSRDIMHAVEMEGTGAFLVTLSCGHRLATRKKELRYLCRECAAEAEGSER